MNSACTLIVYSAALDVVKSNEYVYICVAVPLDDRVSSFMAAAAACSELGEMYSESDNNTTMSSRRNLAKLELIIRIFPAVYILQSSQFANASTDFLTSPYFTYFAMQFSMHSSGTDSFQTSVLSIQVTMTCLAAL